MKVIYDSETDTLTVIFTNTPVAESDEELMNKYLEEWLIKLTQL